MNERIKQLRIFFNLTQSAFGMRLGVSRDVINNLERGRVEIKEHIIKLICVEFSVNEEWLRTGTGEMFKQLSKAELAARMVGNALSSDDEFVQNVFIALGELTPNEWQVIKKVVDKIKGTK